MASFNGILAKLTLEERTELHRHTDELIAEAYVDGLEAGYSQGIHNAYRELRKLAYSNTPLFKED